MIWLRVGNAPSQEHAGTKERNLKMTSNLTAILGQKLNINKTPIRPYGHTNTGANHCLLSGGYYVYNATQVQISIHISWIKYTFMDINNLL